MWTEGKCGCGEWERESLSPRESDDKSMGPKGPIHELDPPAFIVLILPFVSTNSSSTVREKIHSSS